MTDKSKSKSSVKKPSAKRAIPIELKEEKAPSDGNVKESLIGVILIDKTSEVQIGIIKFDSSGVLGYQMIQSGIHVFAFKSIDRLIDQWAKEPLYKKHAKSLGRNSKLPDKILEQEANSCADFLNSLASPLKLGSYAVRAQMVHSKSE